MRGITTLVSSVIALCFAVVSVGHAADIEQPSKIVMRSNGVAAFTLYIPMLVADVNGYFKEEGLKNYEHQTIHGDGTVAIAMAGGSVQFADLGPEAVAVATARGEKLYVIGANSARPSYFVIAKKSIATLQDLKGKNFGVVGPGSTDWSMARALFKRIGVDPKSVQYVTAGIGAPKVSALQAGAIDASFYTESEREFLTGAGFHNLLDTATVWPKYHQRIWAATSDMVEKYPQATKAWLKAMLKARKFIYANKDTTKQIWLKAGGAAATFEAEYRAYLVGYPVAMNIELEGIDAVLDAKKDTGDLPKGFAAQSILRLDLLQAAQKETGITK